MDAFLIEAELLLDWYLAARRRERHRQPARRIHRLVARALAPAIEAPPTWVLRDYHSPNLLWLPEREDVARIGLLDFQDALMGPGRLRRRLAAAGRPRRRAGGRSRSRCSAAMCAARLHDARFDAAGFAQLYATLAAQRATKILGIFARLDRRDGKPQYLRHIPRLLGYLQRSLAHPALAPLKAWYAANVPPLNGL